MKVTFTITLDKEVYECLKVLAKSEYRKAKPTAEMILTKYIKDIFKNESL